MAKLLILRAVAFAALFLAVPQAAFAQELPQSAGDDGEASVFDGDYLIVGGGLAVVPSYEGSDDLVAIPAAGFAGRVAGVRIMARAAGFALDLVPEGKQAKVGLTLGPVLRYRTNRTSNIADPVVEKLGKLPGAIEAGFVVGTEIKGVLNAADQLSLGVDLRWDVSGHGGGMIVSPGASYLTPLSRGDAAGLALVANITDDRYADYNFSVSPAGAAASGLPAYQAGGGLKDIGIGAFVGHDFNGNLLDGGLAIAAGAMYSRLYGSAAESPITSIRGKSSQWIFGAGLAYVF
jgi:outer membrane scaffolding protein for murein synthesis (MipA/OmpV family)